MSFVKIKLLQDGEITLSITDAGPGGGGVEGWGYSDIFIHT